MPEEIGVALVNQYLSCGGAIALGNYICVTGY